MPALRLVPEVWREVLLEPVDRLRDEVELRLVVLPPADLMISLAAFLVRRRMT